MGLSIIILAAGEGTRMCSGTPKVLHTLGGKSLLQHVLAAAQQLNPTAIYVVYGHGGDAVPKNLSQHAVTWVEQSEQLGTGHAVTQVLPNISADDTTLILYGDVPLISYPTLRHLVELSDDNALALLTVQLTNPCGYGRVLRDQLGKVRSIVEDKDASEAQRQVTEINTGLLAVPSKKLKEWLPRLENNNAQGEYYLTDIIATAVAEGMSINTTSPERITEVMGVNNQVQLAELERHYQRQQAEALMLQGVAMRDPNRFDIRGEISAGRDVVIEPNVLVEGRVVLGNNVYIGPNNVLRNVTIGDNVQILPNCVIEDAVIGASCRIGPYARIRPETHLADQVHVGNFVEIKKSDIGGGSKINHLSYIGDTTIGREVNIGAGTITCNYDGANKHHTDIGNQVFVGSNTQLVAPVKVGDGATIGAGSTITRNVPPGELTLSRAPQRTSSSWKRPVKKGK